VSGRKSRLAVWRDGLRDSTLDPTARHVGHVLSTFMDARGFCFLKRETLAAGTGYSVRTIERAIARLEGAGWLRVERGTGHRSNRYFAALPVVASESRHSEWLVATKATRSGDSDDRSGDTGVARKLLKRRKRGDSAASSLEGSSAEPLHVVDECPGCERVVEVVGPDFIYCADCLEKKAAEATGEGAT
jgi:helix-turn-helix protein